MRGPTENKLFKRSESTPFEAMVARRRHLFEVTGHAGPYSPEEFMASGLDPVQASTYDRPEPPPDVLAAMEAEDVAVIAYEQAGQVASEAHFAAERAGGPGLYGMDGRRIEDPVTDEKVRKAQEIAEDALKAWQAAGERLRNARRKSNELQRAWHNQMRVEEYERTAVKKEV